MRFRASADATKQSEYPASTPAEPHVISITVPSLNTGVRFYSGCVFRELRRSAGQPFGRRKLSRINEHFRSIPSAPQAHTQYEHRSNHISNAP